MTAAMEVVPVSSVPLWQYLQAVADRLGVGIESGTVDLGPPMSAYLALDDRVPGHPGRDLALLWDERRGWSAAVETHADEDPIILGYLGGVRAVADPAEVERFAKALRNGWSPSTRPPQFGPTDDLTQFLTSET